MANSVVRVQRVSSSPGSLAFDVCVRDDSGETRHAVTLAANDFKRLARSGEAEGEFVQRCFEFLLEREGKESILARFDVSVIGTYFPEFERSVGGRR